MTYKPLVDLHSYIEIQVSMIRSIAAIIIETDNIFQVVR